MSDESREILLKCISIIEGAAGSAEQEIADDLYLVARNICYVIDRERMNNK